LLPPQMTVLEDGRTVQTSKSRNENNKRFSPNT
jgi:hypothetical protein